MVGDLTRTLFERAALEPGMRVLDLGCGVGDVSLLASSFVGPGGSVLGVDQNPESISFARQRARSAGLEHLRFEVASLQELAAEGPFDALVGRFILLYLPDPVAVLRRLSHAVRPGGVIAFQELDLPTGRAVPEVPLHAQCCRWVVAGFERAGVELHMGSRLPAVFRSAGLGEPELCSSARVGSGAHREMAEWLANTVRSLLPLIESSGAATREAVQIETLADRLQQAVTAGGGVIYAPIGVGAWVRKL